MEQSGLDRKFDSNFMVGLAAGLYPFLHYYNGNFDLADSWVQFFFLFGICLVLPHVLMAISPFVFKLKFLRKFEKYRRTAVNLILFFGLIGLLVFLFKKKALAVTLLGAGLLSFLVYKQLVKIVILQLLLAVLSVFTLIPKLFFISNYTSEWTSQPDAISETVFKTHPNIYLIQPDGYSSFKHLKAPPYNATDTTFQVTLENSGFKLYDDFRSNYYSTLTSNASMFAMKHHYYDNTYRGNLKTYGAQEVVVGEDNVAVQILKKNGYTSHLLTDNSYFLVNRKNSMFEFCNIPQEKVLLWDTGGISGIDIVEDFENLLETTSDSHNFFFIEKTVPSHIMYGEGASLGIPAERERYFERLKMADDWLTALLAQIEKQDKNALVIIAADHGGYVGLSYVKEVENRKLTEVETVSVFNSLLAIKWPNNEEPAYLDLDSNVNLFRNVFAYLAENPSLLENLEPDSSYLPLYEGSKAIFYECIDDAYQVVYKPLDD